MAQFVNIDLFDPYRTFKFHVTWDGETVAGLHRCSALRRTTEVVDGREGGNPSHSGEPPGKTSHEPITLEQGVTLDVAFESWANLVNTLAGDVAMSLPNFRKELTIDLLDEQGQLAISYIVHRAWVSSFTALPDLDASANAVGIRTIILQHDGWERNVAITEPARTWQ